MVFGGARRNQSSFFNPYKKKTFPVILDYSNERDVIAAHTQNELKKKKKKKKKKK